MQDIVGEPWIGFLDPRACAEASTVALVAALHAANEVYSSWFLSDMPESVAAQALQALVHGIARELGARDEEALRELQESGPFDGELAAILAGETEDAPPDPTYPLALRRLYLGLRGAHGDPDAARALLGAFIADQGLGAQREGLLAIVSEAAALSVHRPEGPLPVGASRIGGWPDLPSDLAVPSSATGTPLSLLAQLRLADLRLADLPPAGMLYCFYDLARMPGSSWNAPGAWHVLYHEAETGLVPCDPGSVPALPPLAATALRYLSVDRHAWERRLGVCPDWESLATWERMQALVDTLAEAAPDTGHQVLGDQTTLQDNHPNAESGTWEGRYRLLLDLGPLRQIDQTWGDMGRMTYWIRQAELASRAFGQVQGDTSSH